jgi:histidinol dehydrogenase
MINTAISPDSKKWPEIFNRPTHEDNLKEGITQILNEVRKNGDEALKKYTSRFDGVDLDNLKVNKKELQEAKECVPAELQRAILHAIENIKKYHNAQFPESISLETVPGILTYQIFRPIDKVGLYVPGGTAPLLSSLMMLAVPAIIAKCPEIVVCTPPDEKGNVHPAILFIAQTLGLQSIYKVGGAQAIAAMAYGTESIPAVYKIFGPGNSFVTQAKELVQLDGLSIDMPAGPSEVLVYADADANAAFIASDLLSQAEHGHDSQVILVSADANILDQTKIEIQKQLNDLPRREIAEKALEHSWLILEENEQKAFDLINAYAPEHLILDCNNPESKLPFIRNAGSIFIGPWSAEAIGDYAAGPNHTLPTNHHSRAYSGVSLSTFMKKMSVQKVSKEGFQAIGNTVEILAASEDLIGHQRAVSIRKAYLQNQ